MGTTEVEYPVPEFGNITKSLETPALLFALHSFPHDLSLLPDFCLAVCTLIIDVGFYLI